MKRTPPPPPNAKKSTRAPPPPTRVIPESRDQSENTTNLSVNNLDQQQQRSQVLAQKNQIQNRTIQQQNLNRIQQFVGSSQTQQAQIQTKYEHPQDNFNKEDSITREQNTSISNAQQEIKFERKLMPPKSVPPNTIRKGTGPPPPKSKIPPPTRTQQIKQVQKQQEKQQLVENMKEQQKNNLQEKNLEPQQFQLDKNQDQKIKVQTVIPKTKTPPPLKSTPNSRGVPQPPKPRVLQKVLKVQSQENPKTQTQQQKTSNNQQHTVNKPNESQIPNIQQSIPQIKVQKKTESQKKPIQKPKAYQVPIQKQSQKSKLQQKLQQLRKAKEQMTQQYQERFQAQEDQIREQYTEENNQTINDFTDLQNDQVVMVEQTITQQLEIQLEPIDNQQSLVIDQTKNEPIDQQKGQIQRVQAKNVQIFAQQTKHKQVNKKTLLPPPTSKGKSVIPPPNIRSAPKPGIKQISPLQPNPAQIKPKPFEKKIQQSPIQDLQQQNQRQNKPQVKSQQVPVLVLNEVKIVKPQVKKVEVEVPKQVQSPVATQINKLLQRYHTLKSTYVSNIHQLEELVNFTKKQQQTQIQKINKLLHQLNRKNEQIKQACGLKTETHLEEIPSQQQQLPV